MSDLAAPPSYRRTGARVWRSHCGEASAIEAGGLMSGGALPLRAGSKGGAPVLRRSPAWRSPRYSVAIALAAAWVFFAMAMPGGPFADAAGAAPDGVRLSVSSARVSVGGGQMVVTVSIVNPGETFVGWVEAVGGQRRVLWAAEIAPGADTLDLTTYPLGDDGGVRVRLLDSDETPLTPWARAPLEYEPRALLLAGDTALYAGFLAQAAGWLRVDTGAAAPADGGVLGRYDSIILASPSASDLRTLDADLRRWVEQGGSLVVAAPSRLPRFFSEVFPDAAFDAETTLAASTSLRPAGDGGYFFPFEDVPVPAGLAITPVRLDGARTAVNTLEGTTLLASVGFGRGTVSLVGVGPVEAPTTEEGGGGQAEDVVRLIWEGALQVGAYGTPYTDSPPLDPVHVFVTGRVPSLVWTLLGSLLYTLGVGVASFVLLRRLGRRDAVWWVVPVVVVFATAAVLAGGLWVRGAKQEVFARRTLTVVPTTGTVAGSLEVGVYAPFGGEFGLRLGDDLEPGALGDRAGLFDRPYTIRDGTRVGGEVTYEDIAISPGAGRSVRLRVRDRVAAGALPSVPIEVRRTQGPDAVRLELTNTGAQTLRHLLLVGNGVYQAPDLAPGASLSLQMGVGPVTGDVVRVAANPERPGSRDFMEWEAQSLLWAQWRYGGFWLEEKTSGAPASGSEAAPARTLATPSPSGAPLRLYAFADDPDVADVVTGLSSGAVMHGVVLYEVVLW